MKNYSKSYQDIFSYSELKKYVNEMIDIIPKLKDKTEKFKKTLDELKEYLILYRLPLGYLLLTTSLKIVLIQSYFDGFEKGNIEEIFNIAADFFNFAEVVDSVTEDFQKQCKELGVNFKFSPRKQQEQPDEKLYCIFKKFEYQFRFVREENDDEVFWNLYNQIEESYQYSLASYKEYINNDDYLESTKQFFEEYFQRVENQYKEIRDKINSQITFEDDEPIKDINYPYQLNQTVNINANIDFTNKINHNNIFLNNIQNIPPVKKVSLKQFISDIPIKNRTSFYLKETLKEEENIDLEYKHYIYPFTEINITEIKRQICGFLNSKGGRIFIGITDNKKVFGNNFFPKEKDLARNSITNYTYDFYPKCRNDKIKVYFIPVKDYETEKYIKNRYVIKIVVNQGETNKLYSTTSKSGYSAHIRLQGQCSNLVAEEIENEIIRRYTNPQMQLEENQFIDPEPEIPVYNEDKNEKGGFPNLILYPNKNKNPSHSQPSKKINKRQFKEMKTLKVIGINKESSVKEIESFFSGCGAILMTFFGEKNVNRGYGYLNFDSEEKQRKAYNQFNGAIFKGKRIELRYKEYK